MQIAVNILHIIFCISLIVIVLLQSAKQAGLSGSIAGGAETFFGKNKGRTIDAMLSKWTAVAAIGFLITSIVLQIMMNA
ncbi:preprotein translocase subunit SecG [Acetivibrio clariflavus]|uniref:Protein-export membrane protein SecG n=1 Tax=Acetivibrio clariflavus (strain DSM 19732 / NBRC 101661 / EBR45) TaxID=720554 RepID=G8LYV3_ACECE|nr:preprotein translocase subunit SecG [Acetivibrio clariflavus]AEV67855.1 protein translocase, SecG subunit [Acetivibrio clariflavus DSM 19732]HOP99782.1 preprotein translocase subunit SecG [Acetivibrio clariflavus]HPU41984.1 preprotein translocase subunit SecG [Acetivibrio clariflavus]